MINGDTCRQVRSFDWLARVVELVQPSPEALQSRAHVSGGIIVGVVSDAFGGRRACVIVTFLSLLCVLLIVFAEKSDEMAAGPLLVLLGLMGVLVGG